MELLFKLAVFFIPFDNLFFAPSRGWATISPILFAFYAITNLKELTQSIKVNSKYVFLIVIIAIYSSTLYLFYKPDMANTIDGIVTISFGILLYLSLHIRYIIKEKDIKKDVKILIFAYSLSFLYGLVKFAALKGGVGFVLSAFNLIEKRYYSRLAFSFTEPSFISLHIAGVLYLVCISIKDKLLKKKLIILISLFCALTLISGDSARFLVDFVVILTLVVAKFLVQKKIKFSKKMIVFILIIFISGGLALQIQGNTRVTKMLNGDTYTDMIYSDPSLAARYFRINSSVRGYENEPMKALFGAGLGNTYYFLQYGFIDALEEYANPYTSEVAVLSNSKESQLFCMPIRLISEMGLLWFIAIMLLIFSKVIKNKENVFDLLIILYLYVQFDSYAFYTFPLYLFIIDYKARKRRLAENELGSFEKKKDKHKVGIINYKRLKHYKKEAI